MHRDALAWLEAGDVAELESHLDVFDTLAAPHGRWRKLCRCGLRQRIDIAIGRAVPEGPVGPEARLREQLEALADQAGRGRGGLTPAEKTLAADTRYFGPDLGWGIKVTAAHL
jgi:hypothetical protein